MLTPFPLSTLKLMVPLEKNYKSQKLQIISKFKRRKERIKHKSNKRKEKLLNFLVFFFLNYKRKKAINDDSLKG